MLHGQPTIQHVLSTLLPHYVDTPQLIYSEHYRHSTWTAYTATFILQITAMLNGQPTPQHLLCTLTPCYMDSLHYNIYSPHYRHATWTAYTSTFILYITTILHGQPTIQHYRHATRTA
jgi:hypothetical protein